MGLNMKGNGGIIKQMGKENFGILMEIFTKANELMIKQRDTEYTSTRMAQSMRGTERKIYRTDMEWKLGRMAQSMKDPMLTGKNKAKAFILEMMVRSMMASGTKIKFQDL